MPKFKVKLEKIISETAELTAPDKDLIQQSINLSRPDLNGYRVVDIEEIKSQLELEAEDYASREYIQEDGRWVVAKQTYLEIKRATKSDLPKRGVHKWETYMFNLLKAMGGTAKKIDMLRAVISVNHDNSTCKDVRRLAVTGINNGLGKNLESGKISKPDGRSNMDTVYTLISKN